MHLVIFGLTISSSWGNGHATLWRSLAKALLRRGHTLTFYERDVPYYAAARDLGELPPGGRLRLYTRFEEVELEARRELDRSDLALATSFCADGRAASRLILESRAAIKGFYDLDTPVTLDGLRSGAVPEYLPEGRLDRCLSDFDLLLSYTGGRALRELCAVLGARLAVPLYGSVDPETHRPVAAREQFRANLSYLGTYSADRQPAVERLLLEPARLLPAEHFLIGGAQYPEEFPWAANVGFVEHVEPALHPAFFRSCRATLNVTRGAMARYGYCPSGRLFEAAACGAALLTDRWEGLENFFTPGQEVLTVATGAEVVEALGLTDGELRRMGEAARARALAEHTGACRVRELESICEDVLAGRVPRGAASELQAR